jgi:hypothetical protein
MGGLGAEKSKNLVASSWGCRDGYWTPRLILPSLLFFFWAAFLLLDRTIVSKSEKIAFDVLALVIVQSGIENRDAFMRNAHANSHPGDTPPSWITKS